MSNEERSVLTKISSVLSDVSDIIGIGSRVVREVSNLASKESRRQFLEEAESRATDIKALPRPDTPQKK